MCVVLSESDKRDFALILQFMNHPTHSQKIRVLVKILFYEE